MTEALEENLQRVLGGYRITLPVKFRRRNRIRDGDYVLVVDKWDRLEIIPVDVKRRKPLGGGDR